MRCYHGNTLPGFVATTIMIIIIIFINNHHQQSSSSSSTIIINNHHHHHHQQSSSSSSSSTIIINNRHLLYIAISLLVFPTTCNLTQIPNLVNFMTSNFEGFPSTTSTTNGALGLEVWKSPSLFWYKAYDALAIFPASRAISTDMSLRRCSKRLHPGRLTWNLQITHLERKMILQTSVIMFHVNLPGCKPSWWKQSKYDCKSPAIRYPAIHQQLAAKFQIWLHSDI